MNTLDIIDLKECYVLPLETLNLTNIEVTAIIINSQIITYI